MYNDPAYYFVAFVITVVMIVLIGLVLKLIRVVCNYFKVSTYVVQVVTFAAGFFFYKALLTNWLM